MTHIMTHIKVISDKSIAVPIIYKRKCKDEYLEMCLLKNTV